MERIKYVRRSSIEKAANNMATVAMDILETPKITEEGLLQLENVLKNMETGGKKARDLNADGGRIGLEFQDKERLLRT